MNLLPQAKYLARCRAGIEGKSIMGKNCLVVGATQGIGRAIALLLAQLGANVTVAGRSNEAASKVLEKLRSKHLNTVSGETGQKHSFERVDFTSQKDTKRFVTSTSQKLKDAGGLDYLFLTAGKPPNGKQSITEDGIESHFALQCLGRYSSSLGFSKIMNERGIITVVCAPGGSGEIPKDDCEYLLPENKKQYGIIKAANRDSLFMDSILIQLAKNLRPRKVGVLHLFPGPVHTNAAANAGLPFPLPLLSSIFGPYVMTQAEDYAVAPVSEALNYDLSKGYQGLNQYGAEVKPVAWTQKEENRVMCVEYAERRIQSAAASQNHTTRSASIPGSKRGMHTAAATAASSLRPLTSEDTFPAAQAGISPVKKARRPKKAVLTLTPQAITRLLEIKSDKGMYIKVSVVAKGCAGGAYKLEYISSPAKFDEIVEQDGVTVIVDSKSLLKVIGSVMDFKEDLLSARFTFENPNVVSTCGCEESFATKEDEERLKGAGGKF